MMDVIDYQVSYLLYFLHMVSNCFNNNAEVYCVIMDDTPPHSK